MAGTPDVSYGAVAPAELPGVAALLDRELPVVERGYFAVRFRADPAILPGGVLVARAGDRVVSTVTALAFRLRFGAVSVPCGGVANVATDPAWRGRGLARELLGRAHALFTERRLPLSLLSTGIPRFYEPLGYAAWERPELQVLKPSAGAPDPAVRPLDRARDLPALAVLRDAYGTRLVGWMERDAARWETQFSWTPLYPREDAALGLVSPGPGGAPAAYVRTGGDPASGWGVVLEFGCAAGAEEPARRLGAALAAGATARGLKALRVPAVCRELAQGLTPGAEAVIATPDRRWMLRIADLPALLCLLAPGAADLLGPDPTARLAPHQWVEVVTGARPFSAQPFARRSQIAERDLVRLDAALPRRGSVFWEADAF